MTDAGHDEKRRGPVIDLRGSVPPGVAPATLGEALRLLRLRLHLSRDELAVLASVPAGPIANFENDVSTPSATALRRLTRALALQMGQDRRDLWEDLGTLLDARDLREA